MALFPISRLKVGLCEGIFMQGDGIVMDLAKALEEGAPCAKTLMHVDVCCSDGVKEELERVLPRGAKVVVFDE